MEYYIKLYEMLKDFEHQIKYKKRYRIKHPFLDEIEKFATQCCLIIESGKIFYRARICDEQFINEKGLDLLRYCKYNCAYCFKPDSNKRDLSKFALPFAGYSEKESFVPTNYDLINDGRLNPYYIPILYVAEERDTALYEVRPNTNAIVNMAEIELLHEVKTFDITHKHTYKTSEFMVFKDVLSTLFSRIVTNPREYIVTQFISEFIQDMGFDGIRFDSSLHTNGVNLGIFDIDSCRAISSDLYEVIGIEYGYRTLFKD